MAIFTLTLGRLDAWRALTRAHPRATPRAEAGARATRMDAVEEAVEATMEVMSMSLRLHSCARDGSDSRDVKQDAATSHFVPTFVWRA
jgi:cell wall assembly regulator SMI1